MDRKTYIDGLPLLVLVNMLTITSLEVPRAVLKHQACIKTDVSGRKADITEFHNSNEMLISPLFTTRPGILFFRSVAPKKFDL